MESQPSAEELKSQKTAKKEAKIAQVKAKEAVKQDSLKQQWDEWASNYTTEEEALAHGISTCEKLARDMELIFKNKNEDEYLFLDVTKDDDLMRLVQFDKLKNLWIKRNQPNILSIKKLPLAKKQNIYPFGYKEFWEDTFFSYLENTQLYMYEIKILQQKHTVFSANLIPQVLQELETANLQYGKILDAEERKLINKSFGKLVLLVEYGARNFWKKYWSKSENQLLLPELAN